MTYKGTLWCDSEPPTPRSEWIAEWDARCIATHARTAETAIALLVRAIRRIYRQSSVTVEIGRKRKGTVRGGRQLLITIADRIERGAQHGE